MVSGCENNMVGSNDINSDEVRAAINSVEQEYDLGGGPEIELANYRSLCELLGIQVKGGKAKAYQLARLSEYIYLERGDGNKYLIRGVKEAAAHPEKNIPPHQQGGGPKQPTTKRKKRSDAGSIKQTIFTDEMYKIILLYLCMQGRSDPDSCSGPDPNDDIFSFSIESYCLKMMFGFANSKHLKESRHISSNTRALKTDFFYRHHNYTKDILKQFDKAYQSGRFAPSFRISKNYLLSRYICIDKEGNRILLTEESRKKLSHLAERAADEQKEALRQKLIQEYGGDGLAISMADSEIAKLEARGEFVPKDLNQQKEYNVVKETLRPTEKEISLIEECQKRAMNTTLVSNRTNAKYMGQIKAYDRMFKKSLEDKLGYTKCDILYKYSISRKDLWEAAPKVLGLSDYAQARGIGVNSGKQVGGRAVAHPEQKIDSRALPGPVRRSDSFLQSFLTWKIDDKIIFEALTASTLLNNENFILRFSQNLSRREEEIRAWNTDEIEAILHAAEEEIMSKMISDSGKEDFGDLGLDLDWDRAADLDLDSDSDSDSSGLESDLDSSGLANNKQRQKLRKMDSQNQRVNMIKVETADGYKGDNKYRLAIEHLLRAYVKLGSTDILSFISKQKEITNKIEAGERVSDSIKISG